MPPQPVRPRHPPVRWRSRAAPLLAGPAPAGRDERARAARPGRRPQRDPVAAQRCCGCRRVRHAAMRRVLRMLGQQRGRDAVGPAEAVLQRVFAAAAAVGVVVLDAAQRVLLDQLAFALVDRRHGRQPAPGDGARQRRRGRSRPSPRIAIHCSGAQPLGRSHCWSLPHSVVDRPPCASSALRHGRGQRLGLRRARRAPTNSGTTQAAVRQLRRAPRRQSWSKKAPCCGSQQQRVDRALARLGALRRTRAPRRASPACARKVAIVHSSL